MKCKIPEISWHNRDPVLSVDIQPKCSGAAGKFLRLASGGTDSHVLIWYINYAENGSELHLDVAADLTRHQRAVNVVKWSPNGELLASGDDESVIFIWKQKGESEPLNILDNTSDQDKEIWITLKVLRGHMEDVYDLSWCPNSLYLVSGSVDNTAMIWDVHKGKSQAILRDHKGFVQGVAWDPRNQYIATLSTDRYLRIFDIQSKRVLQRVSKATLPVPESNELHGKRMRIFHDDTLQTFFRRLCFTPDGKLLITPSGVTDYEGATRPLHTSYIFSRYAFKQPAIVLPCPDQYTVAIKCCPIFFKLRPHNAETNPPVVPLPYRMIFAIATKSSVYLYDTQQPQPFGLISNIHYTRLTDITWSSDGCIIVVSSTDGFCSLITFEPGELGEEYEQSAAILSKMMEENSVVKDKKTKKQRENILRKSSTDEVCKEETTLLKPLESLQEQSNEVEKQADENTKIENSKENEQNEVNHGEVKSPTEQSEKTLSLSQPKEDLDVDVKDSTSAKRKLSQDKDVVAVIPTKILLSESIASEIILDKEILSSDEKFESPEKKSHHAATPISVRRHPRTPSHVAATPPPPPPASAVDALKTENSPLSTIAQSKSPRQFKGATPIAVRRTPRAIITTPTTIKKTALLEDALDTWPLEDEAASKENQTKANLVQIDKTADTCDDAKERDTRQFKDKAAPKENQTKSTAASMDKTEAICVEAKEEEEAEESQKDCQKNNESEIKAVDENKRTAKDAIVEKVAAKENVCADAKGDEESQINIQNTNNESEIKSDAADKSTAKEEIEKSIPAKVDAGAKAGDEDDAVREKLTDAKDQDEENVKSKEEDEVKKTDIEESKCEKVLEVKQSNTTNTAEPKTPKQLPSNSSNKTPRRVALTTISTPKSKKKLLD